MEETMASGNRFYRALGHLVSVDVSLGFPKWHFKGRSCLKMQEDARVGLQQSRRNRPSLLFTETC